MYFARNKPILEFKGFFAFVLIFCCYSISESKLVVVSNSEEFQKALDDASPGDNITLQGSDKFIGEFVAKNNGTLKLPITIKTANFDKNVHAEIQGKGTNPSLTIKGDHYNLENIMVFNNESVGILLEGSDAYLDGVVVQDAEQGIILNGLRGYLKTCFLTKVKTGIVLHADYCILKDNFVAGENIVNVMAEKNTCCGTLMGNVFEGKVDIQGKDYKLFDNTIEGKPQS